MMKSIKFIPITLLLIVYGLFNIFAIQTIALAAPMVQSPIKLEAYGISIKPMSSSDGKRTFSEMVVNPFGDGHSVLVQFKISKEQPNQTSVTFYKDDKGLIAYQLNTSADYLFFKARLRDDVHEELIGMGFSPSTKHTGYYTVPELFIMGVDDNGKIVRFPIKFYDSHKKAIVDPENGWGVFSQIYITKEVRTSGNQLLLKSPYSDERPYVRIYWNWTYKCFVINMLHLDV